MSSRAAAKKLTHKAAKAAAPKANKPAPKLVKVAPAKKVAPKAAPPPLAAKKSVPPPPMANKKTMAPPPAPAAKKPLVPPPAMAKKPLVSPPLSATAPLRAEPPKQSLARSFYWSELRIGDDLPPLSKPPIDRVQVARYAGASGDFNRLHLDEPFAHAVGFPGVFAPGMLPMGFISQLLTSWLRRGHVRRLSARFVKIVWPNDEITCRGRIADLRKEHGGCYADVELWAENQKGELVLRGQATCELYESPASGGGDGAGFLFGAPAQGGKLGGAPRQAAPAADPRKAPQGPAKKK